MVTDKLSRRGFIGGTAAALGASTITARRARAAAATEIRALLITGGPTYPKYWEKIVQDFTQKTGITVKYDLLEFTPLTTKTVTLGAAGSDLYDVFSTHTAQIGSFFNYFAPLNDYFSSDDLKDFYEVGVKYLRRSEDQPPRSDSAQHGRPGAVLSQGRLRRAQPEAGGHMGRTRQREREANRKRSLRLGRARPGRPGAAHLQRLSLAGGRRVGR